MCGKTSSEKIGLLLSLRMFTFEVNCQGIWPSNTIIDDSFTSWIDHRWPVYSCIYWPVCPVKYSTQNITKLHYSYRMSVCVSGQGNCADFILNFWISQGSVATQLRWGGTSCHSYIESFLRNLSVKEFFCWSYDQKSSSLFFIHGVHHRCKNVYTFFYFGHFFTLFNVFYVVNVFYF